MRLSIHARILAMVLLGAAPAVGQAEPETDGEATLLIENRLIATFRAPFGQLSPSQRVENAVRNIGALEDPVAPERIVAATVPDGILIKVGNQPLLVIAREDLDPVLEQGVDEVGKRAVAALALALTERAERRRPAYLLQAAGRAALATLVFFTALFVLRRLRGFLAGHLRRLADQRLSQLEVQGIDALRLGVVFARIVVGLAFWTASVFAAYAWLAFVLESFPYTRPWGEALGEYLIATVGDLGREVVAGLPDLLMVLFLFAITRLLARLVTAFFERIEAGKVTVEWCHAETAQATRRIIVGLCWIFGVVFAYPYLPGSGSEAFRAVGVIVGLMVSLGSAGLINQVMSGLVLIYSRALRPGEYVQVGEVEGEVTELGLLSTKIVTARKRLVTIPNAVVVATRTRNDSRLTGDTGAVVSTSVSLGYDVPWRQAHALLLTAAADVPDVRREPAPVVRQRALGDFAVVYKLILRVDRPLEQLRILSELHGRIQDACNEHGVQILSPHFRDQPAEPVVVPRSKWFEPPAGDGSESDR